MTVIQELMQWTDEVNNSIFALMASEKELTMMEQFKAKLESFMDKEKQQLVTAFKVGRLGGLIENGDDSPGVGIYMDPVVYYNNEVFTLKQK